MSKAPLPTTRRALLGASAVGLYAVAEPLSSAAPGADSGSMPCVADREALARLRPVRLGVRAKLVEALRCGEFVAKAKAPLLEQIAADPYQAFYVPSTADRELVWVRDYMGPASLDWSGAQGDGVTDDSAFINAMLGNSHASWFRIEDGRTHLLSEPIRIGRVLTLTGAGVHGSVLMVKTSIDAIHAALPSGAETGLHLADFGVVNAMPDGAAAGGDGIRLHQTYLAKLSNIRIVNCWNGLHATWSALTNVDTIHILGCVNAGLLFDGGNNFDIRVTGFTIGGGTFAIRMDDMCDEMIFTDGVCSSSRYALYTDATNYAVNLRPEFCRFARVSFDSCVNGLDLAKCTDFVFDACFVSCRPENGAEIGIRGPTENIQFVATTFFNGAKSAAIVGARADDTDFHACKFVSNGTAQPNAYDTLVFADGCGSFSLSQNRFRPGWDVASTPRHQVRIGSGTAPYSIIGNHFARGGADVLRDERVGSERALLGNVGL